MLITFPQPSIISGNLNAEGMLSLQELLEAIRILLPVYLNKDDIKQLYRFSPVEEAERFWDHLYKRAMDNEIEPLIVFDQWLKVYLNGILNHYHWPCAPEHL